jgi:hypothetical protein
MHLDRAPPRRDAGTMDFRSPGPQRGSHAMWLAAIFALAVIIVGVILAAQ